jgi:hypothetical protein
VFIKIKFYACCNLPAELGFFRSQSRGVKGHEVKIGVCWFGITWRERRGIAGHVGNAERPTEAQLSVTGRAGSLGLQPLGTVLVAAEFLRRLCVLPTASAFPALALASSLALASLVTTGASAPASDKASRHGGVVQ